MTSFHPGQHNWDITNLPAILYQLHPTAVDQHPENWPKPPQMRDVDGNPMFDPADPTFPILDWTILPFHISTKEDPCVMAAWLRLDPRMSWKDIIARMVPDGRPMPNVLNMRVSRLNVTLDIFPWRDSRQSQQKVENEIKNGKRKPLTTFHTLFNTTRGLTPGWNWSELERHVPVTELKWVGFKGKLAYLNSTTDLVGWKYKPDVDDETLFESEVYEIWHQYPASPYVNKTGQGVARHTARRGRPTVPKTSAPIQPAVAHAINNPPTETDPRKRRQSLSQAGRPSKKQRNTLPATTPDTIDPEIHVGLPVLEPDRDSSAHATEHWQFTKELFPRDTPVSTYSLDRNEFERLPNLDAQGPESVYAYHFDQVCQSTGLRDYDLYTEQILHDAESNTNYFGNEAKHCIEQLSQELTFDADSASRRHSITSDDIDWNPAGHLLEPHPQFWPAVPSHRPVGHTRHNQRSPRKAS